MTSSNFISVEDFYLSHDISTTSPTDPALHLVSSTTISKLKNLGPSRIRDLRNLSVSFSILSHVPLDASPKTCQRLNDMLASSIVTNSDRFAGLALLPCWDAREAANELQRCVTRYKFVGGVLGFRRGTWEAKIYSSDAASFEELWKVAERYQVPIVLRPLFPTKDQVSEFDGQYPGQLPLFLVGPLVTSLYAFHAVSPLLILRLYISGVFDRHPNLRLVVSQNGYSIPQLLPRIETLLSSVPCAYKPTRRFLDVWQHNIYVTTADVLDMATMRALLEQIPIDRVLFAGNYPWEEKGKGLMEELKESGIIRREEWDRIAWRNAEFLFGLRGGHKGSRA